MRRKVAKKLRKIAHEGYPYLREPTTVAEYYLHYNSDRKRYEFLKKLVHTTKPVNHYRKLKKHYKNTGSIHKAIESYREEYLFRLRQNLNSGE